MGRYGPGGISAQCIRGEGFSGGHDTLTWRMILRFKEREREVEVGTRWWEEVGKLMLVRKPDPITSKTAHFISSFMVFVESERTENTIHSGINKTINPWSAFINIHNFRSRDS